MALTAAQIQPLRVCLTAFCTNHAQHTAGYGLEFCDDHKPDIINTQPSPPHEQTPIPPEAIIRPVDIEAVNTTALDQRNKALNRRTPTTPPTKCVESDELHQRRMKRHHESIEAWERTLVTRAVLADGQTIRVPMDTHPDYIYNSDELTIYLDLVRKTQQEDKPGASSPLHKSDTHEFTVSRVMGDGYRIRVTWLDAWDKEDRTQLWKAA